MEQKQQWDKENKKETEEEEDPVELSDWPPVAPLKLFIFLNQYLSPLQWYLWLLDYRQIDEIKYSKIIFFSFIVQYQIEQMREHTIGM